MIAVTQASSEKPSVGVEEKGEIVAGVVYQPLTDDWRLSSDASMNYMLAAARSL